MKKLFFALLVLITGIAQADSDVFAVVTHRGTRYELSNDVVKSCVKLPDYTSVDWKLAWISGRWTGTVKSCWRKEHYAKQRVDINAMPGDPPHWITIPAYDAILVCLPLSKPDPGVEVGPSCQQINPKYFAAVSSLPKPAF